ncbi:MAG: hypothetical protein O2992_01125 [Gemmatimonadetes bacterium]|jgi:hypothetical protein|nr:hypothetical protein [Gemmatimonadota bacterium]
MTGTLILVTAVLGASAEPITPPWGFFCHEMAARAAARALPDQMPAFFRSAGDQPTYLDPEPDRWRSRDLQAMDQALSYDHYMDLENVPEGALDGVAWRGGHPLPAR